MNVIEKLFGTHSERELKMIRPILAKIENLRPEMIAKSDEELRDQTRILKAKLADGATLDDILPEAFATVREAARRTLNMEHFPVQLIGGIVLGYIWQLIFDGIFEKFDLALKLSAKLGFWGLVILICWQQIGYMMIIYIAGLQNVSDDLIEAAQIDGASPWQRFKSITVPLISGAFTINFTLSLINGLKVFDQINVMTDGGPGFTSETLVYLLYKVGFNEGRQGFGTAVGIMLLFIIIILNTLQQKFLRSREVQM